MREEIQLEKGTPFLAQHLTWKPATLSLTNTSKFMVYVRIGGGDKPGAKSFSAAVAPFSSYVDAPEGAQDFAFFVDNTSDPATDFNFPIKIIFSSGAAAVQAPLSPSLVPPTSTAYISKLLGIQSGSLIDIWSTQDPVNTNVVTDTVSGQRNGLYQNSPNLQATLGPDNSNKVAFFNGTNQYGNLLSTSLQSVFNGPEGTLLIWAQLPTAKWNDGNNYIVFDLRVDINNKIRAQKTPGPSFTFFYNAVTKVITVGATSAWIAFGWTWKVPVSARLRGYQAGIQDGGDVGSGVAFAGAPVTADLAADNAGGANWPGSTFIALWTKELTAAEMLSASVAT